MTARSWRDPHRWNWIVRFSSWKIAENEFFHGDA